MTQNIILIIVITALFAAQAFLFSKNENEDHPSDRETRPGEN
jgi:hypothetical protein